MPNAKCDKCNLYLHEICKSKKSKEQFILLMKERSKRLGTFIYSVLPGIKHYEFANNRSVNCEGTMQVRLFDKYPNKEDEELFKRRLFSNENNENYTDSYCLEWLFDITKNCC
jgi:hypothetical protein